MKKERSLKDIGLHFFRIVESGNLNELDEIIHPDYTADSAIVSEGAAALSLIDNSTISTPGIDALRRRIQLFVRQFANISHTMHDIVEQDDKVVFFYQLKMDHVDYWSGFPPTGKQIITSGAHLMHFQDRKIIRIRAQMGVLDIIKQIGVNYDRMTEEQITDYLNRVKLFLDID